MESPLEVTIFSPDIMTKINASTPTAEIRTLITIVARSPKVLKALAGGKILASIVKAYVSKKFRFIWTIFNLKTFFASKK